MNTILLQKQIKPLAVMQGLRPLFLLRCRLAPKQASANRHRRRNSLRSSGLPHSKENLENRLAQFMVFRGCRARPLWPSASYVCNYFHRRPFAGCGIMSVGCGRAQGPHPANGRRSNWELEVTSGPRKISTVPKLFTDQSIHDKNQCKKNVPHVEHALYI